MPVSDKHSEYTKYAPQWTLVNDCVEGSKAVKSRMNNNLAGDAYLPVPDKGEDGDADRFASYLFRANFVNFTGYTKKGMLGMVFRKETNFVLPTELEYLKTNSNGGGLSLEQQIKSTLGGVLETARFGLLTDYPKAEGKNPTKAQVKAQKLQATIQQYKASKILNWRTTVVGAVKKLSLVVLEEAAEVIAEDGFSMDSTVQYRVLKLVDGVYIQEIWGDDQLLQESRIPTKFDGSNWDEIPFQFVGAENNDESIDDAPLYDLAEINLAHYRNSADYEESCFFVGQPTPVLSGLDENWYKKVLNKKIKLGSRSGIPLPVGAEATLLQAEPNQMPLEGMREKEKQAVRIGARLIQDNSGEETAEAAKIRFAGQNSELAGIVGNIEDALETVLGWAGEYMGADEDSIVEVNRQFYDATMDAQQAVALIQFADRGDISQADVRSALRRSGWVDSAKTDEDIDEELQDLDLNLTDEDENNIALSNNTNTATDPALITLLEKLIESTQNKQTFIPAGDGGEESQGVAPVITVEAPVVNVTLPEGLITIPENMVVVTVEAPQIQVDAPEINSPVNVLSGTPDKAFDFQYAADGKTIIGGGLRVVKNGDE